MFAIAWFKGGHPERFSVMVMIVAYLATRMAPRVTVLENLFVYDALIDLALLAVFIRMSLKEPRWWPFLAATVMFLTMIVHLAIALTPELDMRADISARMGLTLLLLLAMLAGVGERWLAGEPPVCQPATWGRRRSLPTAKS